MKDPRSPSIEVKFAHDPWPNSPSLVNSTAIHQQLYIHARQMYMFIDIVYVMYLHIQFYTMWIDTVYMYSITITDVCTISWCYIAQTPISWCLSKDKTYSVSCVMKGWYYMANMKSVGLPAKSVAGGQLASISCFSEAATTVGVNLLTSLNRQRFCSQSSCLIPTHFSPHYLDKLLLFPLQCHFIQSRPEPLLVLHLL